MGNQKDNRNSELGAGLIEYSLLVALISVISITGIQTFAMSTQDKLVETTNTLEKKWATGETSPCTSVIVGGVPVLVCD